ncbi:bifunctional folylpolyglutamate synthase/dihydrofolate synthase [Pseudozobellia thermophila]|uniref:Dihydrofolate synthase/folylpolyglutamate synthase n=1 Tax=Pseudozobellia thermophila TaxID=192903 RepID=A0A1M6NWF9_9FLAO|nr:folylpolyglutamate synthase/dihydrofolate synthase family protein [Pseudozobellia thermophila]SHJ81743.1 dihydrofolate synthase / folylpolyglutamate synthase [Pseudozobellia thermophila]SHJ99992.1 dihydrofolate synthase / folylpolyglutamate synthase [Pseudozobellia thermophila]
MTYQETLDWMFGQLPMYQQQGSKAYNAKLNGILKFVGHLGNPHKRFKSIHVAGTNGKGSSSHMLASILQEAGYRVGLYTSPHLKDFRERIKIDGKPVSKRHVVDFIAKNRSFFERNQLSFFEMTVGMAFDCFAEEKVDIAVVEVGLGGRLDSTNIIEPEVCLITNIGMDHTDMLGDTIEKIAFEKAGIIKTKVPVVISEYQEGAAGVFESVAEEKSAPLVFADRETTDGHTTSLLGLYQFKNVKGVVAAIRALGNFDVGDAHIRSGLQKVVENTGLMGRWQQLNTKPTVICDTAHNKEGLELVVGQLLRQKYRKLHIVLGFVKGKDLKGILPLFPANATYYFCSPKIERGLHVGILADEARAFGLNGDCFSTVSEAYRSAFHAAKPTDFVFVGGSTFTVAEIL